MKSFLVRALVGIAFAVLTLGCATSVGVLTSPTEPPPMGQQDQGNQEKMQEMLYPNPDDPLAK
jgi:hypothetical protein